VSRKGSAVTAMASTSAAGILLLAIAWLATRRLSSSELGFFFSFLSFGAFVRLADFGLASASLLMGGRLAGTGRLSELGSVAVRVRRWSLVSSTLATGTAGLLGWVIFSSTHAREGPSAVSWRGPWAAYLIAVLVNEVTIAQISLREGGGRVTAMWRLRLLQEWISGAVCLGALYVGGGLWSLSLFAATRAASAIVGIAFTASSGGERNEPAYPMRRWMKEVWPFQWKMGMSGLSGFLIFRAFTPIVMLEKGPVTAGEFGLAVALMNLLLTASSAWPLSQTAHYAAMMAARRFRELRGEFPRLLWLSSLLSASAAISAILVLQWARHFGLPFANHFPDLETTALLTAAAVVHHVVACIAMYLRAEGREPFLIPSVIGSIVTAAAIWAAAHFGRPSTIGVTYLVCTVAGLAVAVLLLRAQNHGRTVTLSVDTHQ